MSSSSSFQFKKYLSIKSTMSLEIKFPQPAQAWMPNYSSSCLKLWKSWVWSGLRLRSPPEAVWMSGSCNGFRGTVKPTVKPSTSFSILPRGPRWNYQIVSCPLRASSSSALTLVDSAEEKWYNKLPPLDESVAVHLCPPTAISWKAKAAHPSKTCRITSTLAWWAYSSAGQAARCFTPRRSL